MNARKPLRILFTSAGRRVSLLREFARAAGDMNIALEIHAADAQRFAPAFQVADRRLLVPRIDSGTYIDALLDYCRREAIDGLIPLIDPELRPLSDARGRFAECGTTVVVSSPEVVDIAADKLRMAEFLVENGFHGPRILTKADLARPKFPILTKPRRGSASVGVHILRTPEELAFYRSAEPDRIFQDLIGGQEHTVDVLAGPDGRPLCAVPRRRIEARAGEVSKGCTVRHPALLAESSRLVAALGGCFGMISVQCFLTPPGDVLFIEVNPRCAGGIPLSIRAGADFPRWLMDILLGQVPRIDPDGWTDGLYMLRYDEGIFATEKDLPGPKEGDG